MVNGQLAADALGTSRLPDCFLSPHTTSSLGGNKDHLHRPLGHNPVPMQPKLKEFGDRNGDDCKPLRTTRLRPL